MLDRSEGEEVLLEGGNMDSGVVRVGDTVRRRTGPWTPSVHRLLRALESAGFTGSPRPIGVDDQGREILSYIEGTPVWPHRFDLVRDDDDALAEIASLIAEFHRISTTLRPDPQDQWRPEGRDPTDRPEIICHNDLNAWNLIRTRQGWVFIDWDLAAPGTRLWDIGSAVHTLVPLLHDSGLDTETTARRIKIFADAYGLPPSQRRPLLDAAIERATRAAQELQTRSQAGEQPWVRLASEGHLESWWSMVQHLTRSVPRWAEMI
ncbi:MAG TPA: phosphotransferase [Acidimicrobiales bacterium]|nr:phosphotransferase [Acidimicrobiales bacterium]